MPALSSKLADRDSDLLTTVELIDAALKKLVLGIACGPDDLSVEYLSYAHPSNVVLCGLYKSTLTPRYIPDVD